MALVGNMISDAFHGSASTVNYILFVSAFSMLTLIYLFAASISESFMVHPALMFLVDLLNTIFIFCGAIALPSKLRVHDCSNEVCAKQKKLKRLDGWRKRRREKEEKGNHTDNSFVVVVGLHLKELNNSRCPEPTRALS